MDASTSTPSKRRKEDLTVNINQRLTVTYFDTGEPEGGEPYPTYLFIHGICHNKWTWRAMRDTKPDNYRMIAFTLRGYKGSSDFGPNEPSKHDIGPIIGQDFIDIVNYVIDVLRVPHNNSSSLTIVAWSLGAASVIAGYGSLISLDRGDYPNWTKCISRIVFYEPAGGRGLFLKAWDPRPPKLSGIDNFKRLASLYYGFSDGFFDQPHQFGEPRPDEHYTEGDSLFENHKADWEKCTDNIFEEPPNAFYSKLLYVAGPSVQSEEQREADRVVNNDFARDAIKVIAMSAVRRIQGISTQETLPACVLGTEWVRDVVREVAPNKFLLTWIPGHFNHYMHSLHPKEMWEALRRGQI